jgi:ActR/RegA family two-component response regulator
MTPATPNPILAVTEHGFSATPLSRAAERMGWPVLIEPTTRDLLRSLIETPRLAVLIEINTPDSPAHRLLTAMHLSSQSAKSVAIAAFTDAETERHIRAAGAAVYLSNPTDGQVIDTGEALLPPASPAKTHAPITLKHPAPADPGIAPRAHLADLFAHPPPARAGPRRGFL